MIQRFISGLLIALLPFGLLAQEEKMNALELYEQGEISHNAGHYQESLELLNACLRLNPKFAEAYFTRGSTKEQLKDFQGALTDYNIYHELMPNNPEATLARGVLRYKLGLYELAKEDFQRLSQLPPGETNTIFYRQSPNGGGTTQITTTQGAGKAYLYNYLGLSESQLKNFKQAIVNFDSALRIEPDEADYWVNRGLAKEGIQDFSAQSDYQKALAINPNHSLAQHNLGVLKSKKGEKALAEEKFSEAIESDSTMLYSYVDRAYHRMESGYYKGALDDYNTALTMQASDPEIWLNRGVVKEKLKDLAGAYADYTKAIDLKENLEKAWLNRGNVLSKQGKYKEAIEDYSVAITYSPEYALAFYNRAIARQRLKQNTEACEDIQKAEALGQVVSEKMKKEICKSLIVNR